ncbi:putative Kinase-like domain-containing protein [Seiridium unicorne]|uniref:Kinase-like domain-containing protein n=1 Tax=Seiridium unicorne TaxID=138068 RepID=A0ABR2UFP9_9PEZI
MWDRRGHRVLDPLLLAGTGKWKFDPKFVSTGLQTPCSSAPAPTLVHLTAWALDRHAPGSASDWPAPTTEPHLHTHNMQLRTASSTLRASLSSLQSAKTVSQRPCIPRLDGALKAATARSQGFATALSTPIHNPTDASSLVGASLQGRSGRNYVIEQVLQDRQNRFVYLAQAEKKRFVLKNLDGPEYNYALALQPKLADSPYLRAVQDTIPGQKMFVNEYLTDHLMNFAWKPLPMATQKRILRDALRGLAAMHAHNIAHLDIKANNIMVDYHETTDGIVVDRVQLSDLEDATHIPPAQALRGLQVGNHWWRSPEAHVKGAIGKPTDIFSFAIVSIFLLLRRVIFWMDLPQSTDLSFAILEKQISHFGDWDDIDDFLEYLGRGHPWRQNFNKMAGSFGESNPRRPFALWKSDVLDADFKDLIRQMTCFDPRKRITAQQALDHPWFKDVQEV